MFESSRPGVVEVSTDSEPCLNVDVSGLELKLPHYPAQGASKLTVKYGESLYDGR